MSTRRVTPKEALRRLRRTFKQHLGVGHACASRFFTNSMIYDKAYEISSMLEMMSRMRQHTAGLRYSLSAGSQLVFRANGGAIQRGTWPFIEVSYGVSAIAEIWVNIECRALSAWRQQRAIHGRTYGNAHELDIVVVRPCTSGFPDPNAIFLGVEAKHRPFNKALLKELLGVRREMCFAQHKRPSANRFAWWAPRQLIPASPASGLIAFCSNSNVARYADPAEYWGIEMIHYPA